MRSKHCLITVAILFATALPAFAWHDFGHMVVAAIAYQQLTPVARARAMELLKANEHYKEWQDRVPHGVTGDDVDRDIFIVAATWPDYDTDKSHKPWHYVDKPLSTDKTPLFQIAEPNAVTAITQARKTLESAYSTDKKKSQSLLWVLHLAGDMHQPEHCATRVSKLLPDGDHGANLVQVTTPKGIPSNLHRFWDEILGTDMSPEAAASFGKTLPLAKGASCQNVDPNDWEDEGFKLAKKKIYTPPVEISANSIQLTPKYEAMALTVGKHQVALAGARLAKILNQDLSLTFDNSHQR